MDWLAYFLWWAGYAAALFHFVPSRCDIQPEHVVLPLLKSIVWPITLPASFIWKRFIAKQW